MVLHRSLISVCTSSKHMNSYLMSVCTSSCSLQLTLGQWVYLITVWTPSENMNSYLMSMCNSSDNSGGYI